MLRLASIPAVLILLVIAALYWSGMGGSARADFAFINRGDIYTLDLNQMSYMQDFRLTYGIREGLFAPDGKTLRPVPAGAVSAETSPDGRVWTFKLRPEARWSNGDRVTAHDYAFSWRRLLEEPGEYTYLFYYVKNAENFEKSYTAGDPIDFNSVGIEVPDDLTFRVTLNDPVPYMLELVAFPPFYPRNERSMGAFRAFEDSAAMEAVADWLKKQGKDVKKLTHAELLTELPAFLERGNPPAQHRAAVEKMVRQQSIRHVFRPEYTRPPDVVTNGPFNLVKWEYKRRLVLKKSETYWDAANVKSGSIEMVVSENPLSQFLIYETGQVDWQSDVPGDLAAELKAKGRTDLRSSPAFGTAFLTFLCREKLPDDFGGGANPLADIRVRQALAMAIDKRVIVDTITRMGELPARTYLPPDGTLPDFRFLPGPYDTRTEPYTDVEMRKMLLESLTRAGPGLPYDVELARKLLAEAGYPNGAGFPQLPLMYNTDSAVRAKIVQVLKSQWREKLGITVHIQALEGKAYKERVSKKQYAIAAVAWYGDYPDMSTFTDKYLSTSLQNDSDWQNPTFDGLCLQATKEADDVKRVALLSKAEHLIDTEVPIVPLYHYVNVSLSRDSVRGVRPNPRNVTIFKDVYVEK